MALCASVVIDNITDKIDKPYDYCIPERFVSNVSVGKRVIVPFSRANIKKKALVIRVYDTDDATALKEIIDISEDSVCIDELRMSIIELLKKRYFVTYHKAYKTVIPRGVDIKIKNNFVATDELDKFSPELSAFFKKRRGTVSVEKVPEDLLPLFRCAVHNGLITEEIKAGKEIRDVSVKYLVLNIPNRDLDDYIANIDKRFQKQIDLLSVFFDYTEISEKDALYYSGCSKSTVNTLINKGVISAIDRPVARNPYKNLKRAEDRTPISLSDEQNSVLRSIASNLDNYKVHLINGVTGSGKTMVYMSLIDKMVAMNKSVIFMVPEISLTPQTLEKFYSRYGERVSVAHSGLSIGERADEWRRINSLECSVTVGTRSAVFSPSKNLGLIIIDEEHESCYKSESAPRFHARDISKFICKKLNIPLVLGSATPSVESAFNAEKGIYNSLKLTKRFNNHLLPQTEIIDMRESFKEGNQSFLSDRLKAAITDTLSKNEQAILFLNRRGAHSMVGCRSCGYVAKCPSCGIALTYHLVNDRCMCHYCGYNIRMFDSCPECESKHIKKLGYGTQLVSTDLEEFFPDAKILRMDFDTIDSYVSYGEKLNSFRNGDYNIMLGTQMVAKGLDFPNVTLVGVLNADLSLHVDDFRANERTFSLLTQVCGRSGRAGKEGRAFIQTYSPDYEIIKYAKEQDYEKYYDFEITFRRAMNYPPFCDIVQFTVSNAVENQAYEDVDCLYKAIDRLSKTEFRDIPVRLLYPTVPKIARFNNKHRFILVMKTRLNKRLYQLFDTLNSEYLQSMSSDTVINVNPLNNV